MINSAISLSLQKFNFERDWLKRFIVSNYDQAFVMNDNDVKITGDFNELFCCRPCDDLQKLFPLFFEAYLAKSYVFFSVFTM